MISKLSSRLPNGLFIIMVALGIAACNGEAGKSVQSEKPQTTAPQDLKSLPTVTLTGAKVQQVADKSFERVVITASGTFGSNIVQKTDPERIIVIMHNAQVGEAPKNIDVNDGTVSRVDIDQLDTGKGPAVRITIGLAGKTTYKISPTEGALMIDIRKGN